MVTPMRRATGTSDSTAKTTDCQNRPLVGVASDRLSAIQPNSVHRAGTKKTTKYPAAAASPATDSHLATRRSCECAFASSVVCCSLNLPNIRRSSSELTRHNSRQPNSMTSTAWPRS